MGFRILFIVNFKIKPGKCPDNTKGLLLMKSVQCSQNLQGYNLRLLRLEFIFFTNKRYFSSQLIKNILGSFKQKCPSMTRKIGNVFKIMGNIFPEFLLHGSDLAR